MDYDANGLCPHGREVTILTLGMQCWECREEQEKLPPVHTYEEGRADERTDVVAKLQRWFDYLAGLDKIPDGFDVCGWILEDVKAGKHVGAAKKEGE